MAAVSRPHVVQSLLNLFEAPSYLEIGVNKGVTFHTLKAAHKVAVDPKFVFKERPAAPDGQSAAYHEMTSDAYFGTVATDADVFDVIYLDGLHTFEQTLRDLLNAVLFLSPDGVIVIDDIKPNSYAASIPDLHVARATRKALHIDDPSWMGDVFKLVFFVESFLQQFSFATIEDNHGQLVLWRQRREAVVPRSVEEVARLEYYHCATERDVFRTMPFGRIVEAVLQARPDS